jgi:ADP-ribose pyrophosphatase
MDEGTLLERRPIFDGRIVKLSVDRVRLPNGESCDIEMIRHPGAAAVVPVDGEGRVLLVRQYRYAAAGYLLEVPAGKLDAGEAPELCAVREVEEEVGYRPGRLTPLGFIHTTPGFTDERIWLYLGTELTESTQQLQDDEVLTVERVPFDEAVEMADDGRITDGKSICALLRAARRRASTST